jgi:hypothetical protein
LKHHLLKHYAKDQKVVLVGSAVEKKGKAQFLEATVDSIESLLPHIHFGTTLFIPGSNPKKINRSYLKLLQG